MRSAVSLSLWIAGALAALVLAFSWSRMITDERIDGDDLQTLRMAVNLRYHGVASLDAEPPYAPSMYREPLPVVTTAIAIALADAALGDAGPEAYLAGDRARLVKIQNLFWLALLCVSAFWATYLLTSSRLLGALAVLLMNFDVIPLAEVGLRPLLVDTLMSEVSAAALLLAAGAFLVAAMRTRRVAHFAWAGLCFGMLALTKAAFLYVFVGFAVLLAGHRDYRRPEGAMDCETWTRRRARDRVRGRGRSMDGPQLRSARRISARRTRRCRAVSAGVEKRHDAGRIQRSLLLLGAAAAPAGDRPHAWIFLGATYSAAVACSGSIGSPKRTSIVTTSPRGATRSPRKPSRSFAKRWPSSCGSNASRPKRRRRIRAAGRLRAPAARDQHDCGRPRAASRDDAVVPVARRVLCAARVLGRARVCRVAARLRARRLCLAGARHDHVLRLADALSSALQHTGPADGPS